MKIITIQNIPCYEENGTAYLNLEACARGLGFTQEKNGTAYVRWETVVNYLKEIGFSQQVGKDGFIPENVFYRLAMKAKNETAERFQALIADEVIPSIRKHGMYATPEAVERMLADPDTMITTLQALKAERAERIRLENENATLLPKAEYFDKLVDRNLLTNIRDTAKEFRVREREFSSFLVQNKYMYRDAKGKLMPYAPHVKSGLFEVKEFLNEQNGWKGTQALITPRGRETFRILIKGRIA